jgi:hypothetical protein
MHRPPPKRKDVLVRNARIGKSIHEQEQKRKAQAKALKRASKKRD